MWKKLNMNKVPQSISPVRNPINNIHLALDLSSAASSGGVVSVTGDNR